MGKVLAHPTVGLKIIIVTIKLDSRHNYARIRILLSNPFLDNIINNNKTHCFLLTSVII